ncbi:MAG: RNA pseudouridine synthase [Bacteroidales bacterium]|nr:RNA pseudouridine synthase [Bacteroidales bacterium]
MIHKFSKDISKVSIPTEFNNPFRYTPHQLCLMAAEEVRNYINSRSEWSEELAKGKMFGVLVVSTPTGEVGYLSAYSGLLAGENRHPFFVPPVYDLLSKDSYFQQEEAEISQINRDVEELKTDANYLQLLDIYSEREREIKQQILKYREQVKQHKQERDKKREELTLSQSEQELLIRESQFEKAELKRITDRGKSELAKIREQIDVYTNKIDSLTEERRQRSADLQLWLFRQFRLLNAKGETKDLIEIFSKFGNIFPPAGAGECAAPKMLQYAYQNNLKPIQMAEFWVGASPVGEVRIDGNFYPSCKGKCLSILTHMLQGLKVKEINLEYRDTDTELKVIYEDEYLIAIDKPAGILSVPGKTGGKSVEEIMQERSPNIKVIHRLDMATSGVLLLAKDIEMYKVMQTLFATREVRKTYIALIEGEPKQSIGEISLPLAADYNNRPMQKVDYENGKEAITKYRVLQTYYIDDKRITRLMLNPVTGRTHQLRVHLAHPKSLGMPIIGDELYGKPAERLMLHAMSVVFSHPVTKQTINIESPLPF